jgi:hypothetical protein
LVFGVAVGCGRARRGAIAERQRYGQTTEYGQRRQEHQIAKSSHRLSSFLEPERAKID